MKRLLPIVVTMMFLTGCERMSYEEVQSQIKYCEDKNMKADVVLTGTKAVSHVMCVDTNGARYYPKGN